MVIRAFILKSYLSGGGGGWVDYHMFHIIINLLVARALDIPCFNSLEAKVSYVSSCTSSLEARVGLPHVSYDGAVMYHPSDCWSIT